MTRKTPITIDYSAEALRRISDKQSILKREQLYKKLLATLHTRAKSGSFSFNTSIEYEFDRLLRIPEYANRLRVAGFRVEVHAGYDSTFTISWGDESAERSRVR
jgi:hypothetical protein